MKPATFRFLDSKKPSDIARRRVSNFFQSYAFYACNGFSDQPHVSRLIALPSMRNRCEVGRIGFDEHSIQRHFTYNFAQRFGVFKGDNASKRQIKSQVEVVPSSIIIAREAVDHSADFPGAFTAQ